VSVLTQLSLSALLVILPDAGVITVEVSWICDHVRVYSKAFTHQFTMLLKETTMLELIWKHIVLTLKQRTETCKGQKRAKIMLKLVFYKFLSCNWLICVTRTSHSPYMPDNGVTVLH
jgi:hypothetical protein